MVYAELVEWMRETKASTLDASKREIAMLWTTQLGRIDAAIANPETTPASFKAVVNSCEEFTVAVDAEHNLFFERMDAFLAEMAQRMQAQIDALGTRCKPSVNPRVLRMRAVYKKNVQETYGNTPGRLVIHMRATAADDFAEAVHEIRQYRVDPREVLSMLEKEKLNADVHPSVPPFIVGGFCVGPASRSGRPLVLRTVCRYCTTVFHGKSAREVAKQKPYLEHLLLRQCPVKPEVVCVDSLELARVTHTSPSDEFVVSLRDAHKEHYKSVRADRNRRYYVNQRA